MVPGLSTAATGAAGNKEFADLLPQDEDLLYEEELLRNPYSLRMWWRYLEARKDAASRRRHLLFERALKALPGSYKLWHAYLGERRAGVRNLSITHPAVEALNNTYERALVSMHKMPRVWTDYLELLVGQHKLTHTRRAFDRALAALPITQHDRIWTLYLNFVMQDGIPVETALRVYRRYLKLEPTHTEEYIAYLRKKVIKCHNLNEEAWHEAARLLAQVVNDDTFRSLEGKSKHQLWLELCHIITRHPEQVKEIKVDAVLRSGIRKFTDEVGRLWTSLADYYIRRGLIDKARDVYEEGLTTVTTVRDFSLIFDTLTQFEESLISHRMAHGGDEEATLAPEEGDDGSDFLLKDNGQDIDLRLARLEHLMERRPELLSSVMLRQNPHSVHEWHKRVKIFTGNPTKQILTYTEAVKTVDPDKASGKVHTLWISFAKFYERHGDVPNARVVFEKAAQAEFKYVDDLATVWCEWAEMELRHKNYKKALDLLATATAPPLNLGQRRAAGEERTGPVQGRLYRSLKLWTFYSDLEESLGTIESTRAVYDRIMELKLATPQIVLNYAAFLQEHKHWELSFQVYERAVSRNMFRWPHAGDVWQAYLGQFVERYKGTKLERARDLYKQALEQAPPKNSKQLFLGHAQLEEQYGLAKRSMEVYDAAVRTVPKEERLEVYTLYVNRASKLFGIGKVREIYEAAIEAEDPYGLPDEDCKVLCLRYAKLERSLGEIDRARAILVHASSMADPRRDPGFWRDWNDFEVAHGNEDTFREMLRIKRSVTASFSTTHYNTTIIDASAAAASTGTVEVGEGAGIKRKRGDDMEALEEEAEAEAAAEAGGTSALSAPMASKFVSAGIIQPERPQDSGQAEAAAVAAPANPEELQLDDMDDAAQQQAPATAEPPAPDHDFKLQQRAVPAEVFGSVAAAHEGGSSMGALDRFKKKRPQ